MNTDVTSLHQLQNDLQAALPGDFHVFKVITQEDVSQAGNINPEDGATFEVLVSSEKHNVILQGRVGWMIRMAQKMEFEGWPHEKA